FKTDLRQILFERNRLIRSKASALKNQADFAALESRMKPAAQAILGNDFDRASLFVPIATEAETAKNGIVCENRGGGAQCAAVAQINFASKTPSAAPQGQIWNQPHTPVGRRLETSASGAVIDFTGKPVAVIGFRRAGVHQRPGAKI